MRTIRSLSAITGLLALAAWTNSAHAGHLNTVLEAQLIGPEEVSTGSAMAGDADGRAQAYVFGVDNKPDTLCYLIVGVSKIDELKMAPGNGRAAHIHEGARGANGPVVANLAWPQDGQASDCLSETQDGKFPTKEAGIVQRILKNPASFYINVHNSLHPAGAIRGQLSENMHQH